MRAAMTGRLVQQRIGKHPLDPEGLAQLEASNKNLKFDPPTL
jgi:hypothetical protein